MMQSQVSSQVNMKKEKATIMSLPLEVDIMIIEWLPVEDALNFAKALKLPERVAVQYFAFDSKDIKNILFNKFYDLKPSS
jgi:hypothetical protein